MDRSKKILIVSHCILNQNSVVSPLARAQGAYAQIVSTIMKKGIGIYQLPCPEQICHGIDRLPMTKQQFDTEDYRLYCHKAALSVQQGVRDYIKNGYEIVGLIGIQESPTCSIFGERGIFMEELLSLFKENSIPTHCFDISTNYVECQDNTQLIENLNQFLDG